MNLIETISPDECVGDSLTKINQNFVNLNNFADSIPYIRKHSGIYLEEIITERKDNVYKINTQNSVVHQKKFDTTVNLTTANLIFEDGVAVNSYQFDYTSSSSDPKPVGYFDSISLEENSPVVSVFWTTSSSPALDGTVFALNSATSISNTDRGPIWPNDVVTALYQDNDRLYIGGRFTEVGGSSRKKLAVVNLSGGNLDTTFGYQGSLLGDPLSGVGGDLGDFGTVNTIEKVTIGGENLLIIGGTFSSLSRGRGLTIQSETTGLYRQFYVNGDIYDSIVLGDDLYVVGDFDYINYSPIPKTSPVVKTNSIAKINLTNLIVNPNLSIDVNFAENSSDLFFGSAVINAIACKNNTIYIGGRFIVRKEGQTIAQHLLAINNRGQALSTWLPILNGPVYEIAVDYCSPTNHMYVGGDFTLYYDLVELNTSPRLTPSPDHNYSYVMSFSLALDHSPAAVKTWKPKLNGLVTNITFPDINLPDPSTEVYMLGHFTVVNGESVSYAATIQKATNIFFNYGVKGDWRVYLQGAPILNNNAFIRLTPLAGTNRGFIVGGTFTKINDSVRYYYSNVAAQDENILITPLSSVAFELGGQIVSNGNTFSLPLTSTPTIRSINDVRFPSKLNVSQFYPIEEGFAGLTKNRMCKFFLRRPGYIDDNTYTGLLSSDDTFKQPVYVLGWSIDYSKNFQ